MIIIIKEIEKILKSKNYSGYRANKNYIYGGENIQKLEKAWAKYFKVKHAIACNSATSGLWAAIAYYCSLNYTNINKNINYWYQAPEVIVSPYTMTCSTTLPLMFGLKPVFADIEKGYYCIDPESIKKKINHRTVGIIAVDLFGMPFSEEINKIAKDNTVFLIEDAAQAIGSTRNGKYAGTLGDIGVYSLNQHKHLSAGEGGIMVTDDDEIALGLRLLINHAEAVNNELNISKYQQFVGMNLRMTEITAIIALNELKNIDKRIKPFVENAKYFDIPIRKNCTSTYYKYASLNDKNPDPERFDMKQGYITPLYQMPLFRSLGYNQHECKICEEVQSIIHIASLKEEFK